MEVCRAPAVDTDCTADAGALVSSRTAAAHVGHDGGEGQTADLQQLQ